MTRSIPFILFLFLSAQLSAQNFTGQWKGEFVDNSSGYVGWGGNHCEYVLEIECNGNVVTGYSYTYFSEGGKRYYTICKLSGKLNKRSKYIEIRETERTKTNVPVNVRNCFQIHRLTYFQQGDEQQLQGTWVPAPNQTGDCGFGTTVLARRVLKRNASVYNNATAPVTKKPPVKKSSPPIVKATPKTTRPPIVEKKAVVKPPDPVTVKTPREENGVIDVKTQPNKETEPLVKPAGTDLATARTGAPEYEKRNSDLIKSIEIDNASFTVFLYDNGEIDGDSISLFFNGKLLLSKKRLSEKALQLKLEVDSKRDVNELIMYAENLGTIPPNTALMVVNDGDNRYEVRISSDLQKSGVIRFIHRPKVKQ